MKKTSNIFTKGVIAGADILKHPKDSLFSAKNAEFLSTDGNLYAVTNSKGFKQIGAIQAGFIPVASGSNKGVSYIFSIEVNGDVPTGRAEIGCYPSPQWNKNGVIEMRDVYSPLRNYKGDTDSYPALNGPFRSYHFNIMEGSDYELEIQNDYDGSVNLIVNDGVNPPWLINSGFAAKPGGKAEIIEREGKATNRYTRENFSNTLRLVLNSTKIMNLKFRGVNDGGQLKAGHYRYYFYYMTNDGTLTQMVNESMDVHVFNGNSPADIIGDRGTGDQTNKLVSFELKNLDISFPYVKIFYTYSFGEAESISSAFELVNPVRFQNQSVIFTHTGFEAFNGTSPDFLNKRIGSIESVGSIAQVQGRLFAARIKEKGRNLKLFRQFAGRTILGSEQINMDIFGTGPNLGNIAGGSTGDSPVADAYAGGYYNPHNIYHKTGYFGNETYPFGLVFIYRDGSVTPAFPVLGVDNSDGMKDTMLQSVRYSDIDRMIDEGGYLSGDQDLVNTNGIYRFPKREVSNGILLDQFNPGQAKINGITFKLPDIDSPEYAAIKEETVGYFLVRGERRPDLLTQGYLFDTITIPAVDIGNPNEPNQSIARFRGGYSDITSKFIPAFDFTLEAVKAYETYREKGERMRSNYKGEGGIHPFKFNFKGRDFAFREKFAFVSPEVILDKDKMLQNLSSREVELHVIGKANTRYEFPSPSAIETGNKHFSMIRTMHFDRSTQVLDGKANWVIGGSGLKNNEGFSGAAFFNARQDEAGRDIRYYHFPIHFNDYVGITIPNKYSLGEPAVFSEEDGVKQPGLYGGQKTASALVNIYQNGGPRTVSTLKSIYANTLNESYQQISPRIYWNDQIEGADPEISSAALKNANGEILAFGGDCYINPVFRRVFFNQYKDISSESDDTNENSKTNVGYTLGMVTESYLNAALRSEEQADINEQGKRTFAPYGLTTSDPGDKYGEGNPLRKSRLLESQIHNKGFKAVRSQRHYFTLSDDSSFVGSEWFARIIASASHIPNSFDNGYRNLGGANFQDYNPELGKIVRVLNYNNNLVAVYENGLVTIPVNQRIQTGSDAGGSVFLEAQGVLPPASSPVSLDTGSKWHDSISLSKGTLLGVDSDRDVIWRFDGNGFSEISLLRYDPVVREFLRAYKKSDKSLSKNIVSNFDGKRMIWSFLGKENGDSTIVFDLLLGEFAGSTDYVPQHSFRLPGRFLSFDSQDQRFRFWEHGSDQVNYGLYYGRQHPFKISFVVNDEPGLQKVFDTLDIISNHVLPDTISYKTQGTATMQTIRFDPRFRRLSNANYLNNQVNVSIPPVENVTDESAYNFVDSFRANARGVIRKKSRQKGHAVLIELTYNAKSLVKINEVLTTYRESK